MSGGITIKVWPIITEGMQTNSMKPGILAEDETLKIGVYCNHFRSQHKNKEFALSQLFKIRESFEENVGD